MCDDDIHPGLIVNPAVSRRAFGLMTVAAAGAAGSARAAVPVVEKEVDVKTADGVADAAGLASRWAARHRHDCTQQAR